MQETQVAERLDELTAEADRAVAANPDTEWKQPPGAYVQEATDLLPEGAPWHHIAEVAHALKDENGE